MIENFFICQINVHNNIILYNISMKHISDRMFISANRFLLIQINY